MRGYLVNSARPSGRGVEPTILAADLGLLACDSWLLTPDFSPKNLKFYERTQHVVENRDEEFWKPSIYLKVKMLPD